MTGGEKLAAEARRSIGTPFHHQGRLPQVGLDCIGMVVVALRAVGFCVRDRLDYGMRPDGRALEDGLIAHGAVRVEGEPAAGDVLLFRYDGQPQHVALALGGGRMVHAFAPAGAVVESGIGAYWARRLVAVYRLPLD